MNRDDITTPIVDFTDQYQKRKPLRFHMPGHKGKTFLGCEKWDITEITGADSLYEAKGIISISEKNTSSLFGTGGSFFSTEGSSHCIKAMLFLLLQGYKGKERPYIIAGRNAHKSFLYSAALLDIDVLWLYGKERESICSCNISSKDFAEDIDRIICKREYAPIGVYITTPDYLGNLMDLEALSRICHDRNLLLAVDNAHGAYLHFLEKPRHPMDLGADICCDSAHKTLPVLTGGAYLHISRKKKENWGKEAKQALSIFGSTSPSYLIMRSLDLCNRYLAKEYLFLLKEIILVINGMKERLEKKGFKVMTTEPLKMTLFFSYSNEQNHVFSGGWLAEKLEEYGIYCEYSDPEFVVFMFTPQNTKDEILYLEEKLLALGENIIELEEYFKELKRNEKERTPAVSIRKAIFSKQKTIFIRDAVGKVCASPIVSCPPAIPVVVSGEVILKEDLPVFDYYGIELINVVSDE